MSSAGEGKKTDGKESKAASSTTAGTEKASPVGDNEVAVARSESHESGKLSTPDSVEVKDTGSAAGQVPLSPQSQGGSYPQMYPPHLTPQPGAGYYLPVYPQAQVTPEPNSPAGPHSVYDASSFLQQQAALNCFGAGGQYAGVPQPPLSPHGGPVPPASPLFPRVSNNSNSVDQRLDSPGFPAPGTPVQGISVSGLPYLSSPLGPGASGSYGGMYQGYGGSFNAANGVPASSTASDDSPKWSEMNQQPNSFPPLSPQPYLRRMSSSRSHSFDEMLPPAMLDPHETNGNPAYSPYGSNQTGSVGGGSTLFAHQHQWGYAPAGDMYNAPQSPLQPRPTGMQPFPGVLPPTLRPPLGPQGGYNPYYATSPGPPIQTTACNKGPDGANLFIFHIPNNFTNLDMYHLFCPYGNLLSVRIMVERDTGRSRGFGFVSYDNPESAAMAIKELNGYAIGNKRLKVQHKQIRPADQHQHQQQSGYEGGYTSGEHGIPATLQVQPGAGVGWYEGQTAPPQDRPEDGNAEVAPQHNSRSGQEVEGRGDENHASAPIDSGLPELPKIGEKTGGTGLSPLTSLETMRNALPEMEENTGTN